MQAQTFPALFPEVAHPLLPRCAPGMSLNRSSSPNSPAWAHHSRTLLNLGEQEENWRISR